MGGRARLDSAPVLERIPYAGVAVADRDAAFPHPEGACGVPTERVERVA